jgi:hypothetical protein
MRGARRRMVLFAALRQSSQCNLRGCSASSREKLIISCFTVKSDCPQGWGGGGAGPASVKRRRRSVLSDRCGTRAAQVEYSTDFHGLAQTVVQGRLACRASDSPSGPRNALLYEVLLAGRSTAAATKRREASAVNSARPGCLSSVRPDRVPRAGKRRGHDEEWRPLR